METIKQKVLPIVVMYRVDQKKVALVQKKVANFILHLETSGFFYWLNLVLWILNL